MKRGWPVAALLPALLLVFSSIGAPLHGSHLFRQAHVAANIETYLRDGISLRPRTYNQDVPLTLYDFPAYQMAVAEASRLSGEDPLVMAHLLGALCLVLSLASLSGLMARTGVPKVQRALALVFFAYGSLNLFYFQTPLVDTLAEAASLLSLLAFAVWNDTAEGPWWGLMVMSGVLATLIKNPVELPIVLATVWMRWRTQGRRGLASPGMLVYVAAVVATVLAFKLYANAVNGTQGLISPWEEEQYFGTVGERLDPEAWRPILRTSTFLVLNPLTVVLAAGGALVWLFRSRSRRRAVFGGLLLGAFGTVFVFLNRYRVHNYYELPLVFPLAFFAAYGIQRIRVLGRAWRRRGRRAVTALGATAILLSLLSTAVFAWRGYDELAAVDPAKQARGEWVRAVSSPNDFVVWVVGGDDDNWNPAFLYFAKRDGYNLNLRHLEADTLMALYNRFAARHRRVFLFCSNREEAERVESMGAHPFASDKARRLYLIEPYWLGEGRPPPTQQASR